MRPFWSKSSLSLCEERRHHNTNQTRDIVSQLFLTIKAQHDTMDLVERKKNHLALKGKLLAITQENTKVSLLVL